MGKRNVGSSHTSGASAPGYVLRATLTDMLREALTSGVEATLHTVLTVVAEVACVVDEALVGLNEET